MPFSRWSENAGAALADARRRGLMRELPEEEPGEHSHRGDRERLAREHERAAVEAHVSWR